MAKGKYKNKSNKNNNKQQAQQKKQYLKEKANNSKNNNRAAAPAKSTKKISLQPIDIVTIIFTAVIIGLMIFVVYDQFADSNNSGNNQSISTAAPDNSSTPSATAAATATPKPTLSDIGNIYGNITNDSKVAVIDEREYFISCDNDGKSHIYVNVDNKVKDLIQTDASSLSVVTDYLSYTDQKDVSSYYVFYINADGNICYVKDEPVGTGITETTNAKEQVFLEGNYSSIDVSGEYVYHLDSAGKIEQTSILDKKTTAISSEKDYSDFVLYYGAIYAKCIDDNNIYSISLKDSSKKETKLISTPCENFVLDNNWIYVFDDEGISRYSISGSDLKETVLSKSKITALNVYSDSIFYIRKDKLYTCSAKSLLLGENPTEICETESETINVSSNAIYLTEKDNMLFKSSYDKESKTYTTPAEMK